MSTLIEQLERQIAYLEGKHGSDRKSVKDLKEQLRALKENGDKTALEVYNLQAVQLPPSAERPETEDDGK